MPCHLAALPPSGSRCRAQNPFNWHSALVLTVSVTATRAIPPVPAPSGAPAMPSPPKPPRCAPLVPEALPSTAMIFSLAIRSTPPWRNRRLRRCGRFGDRLSVPTLTYCCVHMADCYYCKYAYGDEYKRNCLIFDDIPDEIRKAYNPFDSCASAQILIKKSRKK